MIRLKSVALALRIYAADADGRPPESLQALVPKYMSQQQFDTSLYRDPISHHTENWIYLGNPAAQVSNETIVLASPSTQLCPPHLMHHRMVGHIDTVVEIITDEKFKRYVSATVQSKP
jgi:hypothetical protein